MSFYGGEGMILFRLIKDGKVVGYEKHENGNIYHLMPEEYILHSKGGSTILWDGRLDENGLMNLKNIHRSYIPHDRKDMWTGMVLDDGAKVFNRDRVELTKKAWKHEEGTEVEEVRVEGIININMHDGVRIIDENENSILTQEALFMGQENKYGLLYAKNLKIIGIEGVE
jgi:hypothetical protein